MGIGAKNLSRVLDLCKAGRLQPGSSIMELGAQEIYCQGMTDFLKEFVAYFVAHRAEGWNATAQTDDQIARIANRGFASTLFKACGFEYRALDIFDGEGVLLFDLNLHTIPPELEGRFDLVTNFGTTEHVINQYLSMKTMHELTKPGGVIYHDLPMGGYHNHGYFSYNPMLFEHLAQANDYKVLFRWYSINDKPTPAPESMRQSGYSQSGWLDQGIEYVLQKNSAAEFRMPLETGTSLGVNPAVWAGSDPYGREREALNPALLSKEALDFPPSGAVAATPKKILQAFTGWELQRELAGRYARRVKRLLGLR
jgi:hypothetical protein